MDPRNLLVVLPNWVGDVVLATPALAAIRQRYAHAWITHLCRRYVADVVSNCEWADEVVLWPDGFDRDSTPRTIFGLGQRLRRRSYDLAVLFPNSFRSALAAWLAGARRRVGYARGGRSWLLSDRLETPRDGRRFRPVSMLEYYAGLAAGAGCDVGGRRPQLFVSADDEARLSERLNGTRATGRPLVVLNPGGAFGTAKLWPADRFARVGDALVREFGAKVVVTAASSEAKIARAVQEAAREPMTSFYDPPLGLGPLKALIRRADLLITNDTGPRHFAIAFQVPVVTVFGPTDPAWTETHFERERAVLLDLACQPCQKKHCPLGHNNCMKELGPDLVLNAARSLLRERFGGRAAAVASDGAAP